MRVTKNIREYIEAEVMKRIEPKYAAEAAEAKRQDDLHSAFLEGASKAAEEAFLKYCHKNFVDIEDFCELKVDDEYGCPHFYDSRAAVIRDKCYTNNVHNWRTRMRNEATQIAKDIIVTLELGGGRAELEEMLNNI